MVLPLGRQMNCCTSSTPDGLQCHTAVKGNRNRDNVMHELHQIDVIFVYRGYVQMTLNRGKAVIMVVQL